MHRGNTLFKPSNNELLHANLEKYKVEILNIECQIMKFFPMIHNLANIVVSKRLTERARISSLILDPDGLDKLETKQSQTHNKREEETALQGEVYIKLILVIDQLYILDERSDVSRLYHNLIAAADNVKKTVKSYSVESQAYLKPIVDAIDVVLPVLKKVMPVEKKEEGKKAGLSQ